MTSRPDSRARHVARTLLAHLRRVGGTSLVAASVRTKPLSRNFGLGRGTPVDRYYIESFLRQHAADVAGHVLEVEDDVYTRSFGKDRVIRGDILHVTGNARSTIVGDLTAAGTLPPATFDCIILTQTLHLIFDMGSAVKQLHQALRPGGVLLLTVPGITPVDQGEWKSSWYWSLTASALEKLLGDAFGEDRVRVQTRGNLYAATSFLLGAALEEVSMTKLAPVDEAFPVIVSARAVA